MVLNPSAQHWLPIAARYARREHLALLERCVVAGFLVIAVLGNL